MNKEKILELLEEIKKVIEEDKEIEENKTKDKKSKIIIESIIDNSIIYRSQKTTFKEAVEEAVSRGLSLTGANLTGANLSGAYLAGGKFVNADFSGANLTGADLSNADFSGANLTGANLFGAKLNGTLYYMGIGFRNFEALCRAIRTIRHKDGKFEDFDKKVV